MSIAYVDSTCLYGIVDVLSRSAPDRSYEWAWKTSVETSCALIASRNVRLAPSPTQDGPASGSFGQLIIALNEFVGIADSSTSAVLASKDATKAWAKGNGTLLTHAYDDLKRDEDNFLPWLDWAVANIWEEHSRRLNGLFDPDFVPEIAAVLCVSESELRAAWKLSSDPKKAAAIAKRREKDGQFGLLCDAYIISALIRGVYHDYVAQGNSWQIMHHPLRHGIFPDSGLSQADDYHVSNTERYFSNILMASAFSEPRGSRVDSWTHNTIAARKAVRVGAIDLRPKDHEEIALQVAIRAAKALDIRFHTKRIDQALGVASSLGFGSLASFTLTGWAGILASAGLTGAGMAAQVLAKDKDPARRIVGIYSASDRRVGNLAQAGPGRIRRNWFRRSG